MRTIIAGPRTCTDYFLVESAIAQSGFEITEVCSGRARGVDRLGEDWAAARGIPIAYFRAEWNHYGLGAGFLRNKEMAEYADALIAVWNGTSRGTNHMITVAQKKGLKIYVYCYEEK